MKVFVAIIPTYYETIAVAETPEEATRLACVKAWAAALVMFGLCVFGLAVGVAYAPQANAEVSAVCYAHLHGKQTAITPAADRRYHLGRGEESPCTEYGANADSEADGSRRATAPSEGGASRSEGKNKDRDKKSRFCRKHWYCW